VRDAVRDGVRGDVCDTARDGVRPAGEKGRAALPVLRFGAPRWIDSGHPL